jgi:hypothetical protein
MGDYEHTRFNQGQRFPFGLSRLILQYSLYSKNEGKNHASIFTTGKPYIQDARFFLPACKNRSISIENRKRLSDKIETRQSRRKPLYFPCAALSKFKLCST